MSEHEKAPATPLKTLAEVLFGAQLEADRSDLSQDAREREPRSALTHVAALSASKSADGLFDPKLILAALLQTLAAPTGLVGLLVPIREAGALLPQIALAGPVDQARRTKLFWVAGSLGQALAALAIAGFAIATSGLTAGIGILVSLGVLALARSACSVSYKTILGKTVDQSHRGRTTGIATSVGAATTLVGAAILIFELAERDALLISFVIAAAVFWALAALTLLSLPEIPGEPDTGKPDLEDQVEAFTPALEKTWFRQFIATRALLSATAFAPPYFLLALEGSIQLASVGWLVLSSAGASLLSGYVWGRLSDYSSRLTLIIAAISATAVLGVSASLVILDLFNTPTAAIGLFGLMLSYQGVRSGRSTYLVDKAEARLRARYSALANTIMGVLLLLGGGVAALAQAFGSAVAMSGLALACLAAVAFARALPEATEKDEAS
jgi:MFS family permease